MKNIFSFLLMFFLCLCLGCDNSSENQNTEVSIIEIGNYRFKFPNGFELNAGQGIDSYIGTIDGEGISLFFDYGRYTSSATNLPISDYYVIENEVNGHYRQIVKSLNPILNPTSIHLYKISDSVGSVFGYNSLTLSINSVSIAQQEMIINVFNTVEIIE